MSEANGSAGQSTKTLRAKAEAGIILTPAEVRLFVQATRKSFTAALSRVPEKQTGDKLSRNKDVPQTEIDFF
jgi:hypothetical protein